MTGLRDLPAVSSELLPFHLREAARGGRDAGLSSWVPSASPPRLLLPTGTRGHAWRAWSRLRPQIILALPVLLLGLAAAFSLQAWRTDGANGTIAALEGGRDVAVAADAPAPVLTARVGFLAGRGRLEEAEPLLAALDAGGDPGAVARARYLVANARMREAFGQLALGELGKAGPQVTLARQDYRRALSAQPQFWDAKFNLDVASRLIRDYPELSRGDGDELRVEPKKIWTDIPGQPKGGP
jgi:mxaK protein